jgi:uncharacterized CHY-type Zn-finger protein
MATVVNEDVFDTSEFFECYHCGETFNHYDEPAHVLYRSKTKSTLICGGCAEKMAQYHKVKGVQSG